MTAAASPVLVVGGGPAGLRAAEIAAGAGAQVILCESQPAVGRKFLVAGRGGLNLTHSEPVENFPARYGAEQERWRDLLSDFPPDQLREWAAQLQVETYVGTSNRVFPKGQKAAVLLRAWVQRLRKSGVEFRNATQVTGLTRDGAAWRVEFRGGNSITAPAVVLALGGASWPETGSDGSWSAMLQEHGVEVESWQAANCGWNVDWPPELLARAEGLPLKNLAVSAGSEMVSGELLITRYGLEGGAIYRLGPLLRAMAEPQITIDLKPQVTPEKLHERLANTPRPNEWLRALKLSPAAIALLETFRGHAEACPSEARSDAAPNVIVADTAALIARIKSFPVRLTSPRPIAEAISSAGGVLWRELDEQLMLRKLPGVFLAGEMIDWEAPTGGYLLQGCFATGTRAGRAAAAWRMAAG